MAIGSRNHSIRLESYNHGMPKPEPEGSPSIQVDLPRNIVELLGPSEAEAALCLKQLALIELFRRGEISTLDAAPLLGITRVDFIKLLDAHDVPYIDMTPEELREEFEVARALFRAPVE
jgi:hypothetical protein